MTELIYEKHFVKDLKDKVPVLCPCLGVPHCSSVPPPQLANRQAGALSHWARAWYSGCSPQFCDQDPLIMQTTIFQCSLVYFLYIEYLFL